ALRGCHLVKESDESRWIVTTSPGVLDSELVRLQLEIAADAKKVQIQQEAQAVVAVLNCVIRAYAGSAAGKDDCGDLGALEKDVGDLGPQHQLMSMPRDDMTHLVAEHAGNFRFIIGSFKQASFDKEVTAWKGERVDSF